MRASSVIGDRVPRTVGCALLAFGLMLGMSAPAAAGNFDPTALLACRGVVDTQVRLACFDREAAALAAAPTAAAAAQADFFGLPDANIAAKEVAAGVRPAPVERIVAHLTAIRQAATGRFVFTLDNGQVWTQLRSEGELLAKVGDSVTVSRAALGSYWLELSSRRGCKVTRLH